MCKIRVLSFTIYLASLMLRGTTVVSGIPSIDLIFTCEQGAVALVGLSFFHLMFFQQDNFLQLLNLMKQGSSNKTSNTSKTWRKLLSTYFFFVLGLVWLIFWNLGRVFFSGTLKQEMEQKWYFFIENVQNYSGLEEPETWKLGVGLLFEIMEWDALNIAIFAVAFVYSVAVTICKTVMHLLKSVENMENYLVVSSEMVASS